MNDPIADILAECLDAVETGTATPADCIARYPAHQQELAELFQLVGVIRKSSAVNPSAKFLTESPSRLVKRLSVRELKVRQPSAVAIIWINTVLRLFANPIRTASVLTVIILLVFGSGTVFASSGAIPGDMLYPVKISVEAIRLAVAPPDEAAHLKIEFTQNRAQELGALIEKGRYEQVVDTAKDLTQSVQEAAKGVSTIHPDQPTLAGELAGELNQTLSNNITVLNQVLQKVPDTAKPAIQQAITVSSHEQQAVGTPNENASNNATTTGPNINYGNGPNPPGVGQGNETTLPNGRPVIDGHPVHPTDKPNGKPTDQPPVQSGHNPPGQSNNPGNGNPYPPGQSNNPGNGYPAPPGRSNHPGQGNNSPPGQGNNAPPGQGNSAPPVPSDTPSPTIEPSGTPTATLEPSGTPSPTIDLSGTPTSTVDPGGGGPPGQGNSSNPGHNGHNPPGHNTTAIPPQY